MDITRTALHWGRYDVVADGGRVVEVRPVPGDTTVSAIGPGMPEALNAPYRLTEPMVRKGWLDDGPKRGTNHRGSEPFVAVSWERATELAASELRRVIDTHGNEAIYGGSYGWGSAGRFHHPQSQIHRFLRSLGGYTDSTGSYSVGAMEVILPHVIGGDPWSIWQRGTMWPDIAEHGELVVSFGGMATKNAQLNPGGQGRSEQLEWQRRARAAGVRFVTVSPLAGDTAADLDAQWLPLRPGTDVAVMLALAYVLQAEGLHDREFLATCCVGYDRFERYVRGLDDGRPKTPAWAESISGVDADAIVDLAREMGTRRTAVNLSWSIQRQDHGEQPYWMGVVLAAMSGSLGRPGGGVASGLGINKTGVRARRWPVASLPQGTNAVSTSIPVARIADALLEPGGAYEYNGERRTYPDLRLVYWAGGNPFHHHQDLNKLAQAWQQPETVIAHDSWWNPLTRFADIVFPVATAVERRDIAAGASDLSLMAMERAVAPPEGVRTDYDAFAGIADLLGVGKEFTEGRTADEWVDELYERTRRTFADLGLEAPGAAEFWRAGGFETPEFTSVVAGDFGRLRDDPDRHPLSTPSGRIEIFSERIAGFGYDDCPGHPVWLEPHEWLGAAATATYPLHLLSNQPSTRLHSQYDGGRLSRESKVAGREPIAMHPDDAARRGLGDGDLVRVFNDRGSMLAGLRVDSGQRPGVAVIATGAWFDPEPAGAYARMCRHGNPNVLTRDQGTSRLAQAPAPGSTLVEIERFDGAVPPVRAFVPPEIIGRDGA
ncbi:molybdopterin-dependent oxidoreductase [Solicola gregarius]|uniref:Molybdopterin-dependent oxidoreductase n=1 Tax=Solicola gregarius TaxID=2908642 RepID=A0AA46TKH3_9ACTN|nr:molybdopterin-dependent oxidoreductase [Solicola gregarius]UYM06951.1 molybdopterin-dependent oxidoreductase [Solicola gregarius]